MNSEAPPKSLTIKLLLVTLSAILIFGGMFIVVFFSFDKIKALITNIVERDVPQVVENSQVSNELTGMFADLVMGMFYGE